MKPPTSATEDNYSEDEGRLTAEVSADPVTACSGTRFESLLMKRPGTGPGIFLLVH